MAPPEPVRSLGVKFFQPPHSPLLKEPTDSAVHAGKAGVVCESGRDATPSSSRAIFGT